jgi:uncharacterized protein YecE (DUF72 family)
MAEIRVGTSAFTAAGWEGSFYPAGMRPTEYLTYYATRFDTVEVDSTFYGTPAVSTVKGWYAKTPPGFLFAAKVPQVITHEKMLVGCDEDFRLFLTTMDTLQEKLGPLLLQFPYFNRSRFQSSAEFLAILKPFLAKLPKSHRFALEIRNKAWVNPQFTGLLREHDVALALLDQSWMPRPWEVPNSFDLLTTDFAYIRWLGDRKGIEELTTTWDKEVVDRTADLQEWVKICHTILHRGTKVLAFANNHYAGHGPATIARFLELWRNSK